MYTFNLSRSQKPGGSKGAKGAKKDGPAGVPSGEDAIDIRPIDMAAKNTRKQHNNDDQVAAHNNPEEEKARSGGDGKGTERTTSQASRSIPRVSANSFCPTY